MRTHSFIRLPRALETAACLALLVATPAAHGASGQERAEDAGRELLGERAPALALKTIDGQPIDLESFYGRRPVYLKFWATWCVPCRQQMPHFEHSYETRGGELAVIAVNTGFNETASDVIAYRRALGLKMPIVIDDGRLARAFHLRVTPQHIVIGRDGRILYVGHLVDDALEHALAQALAEPAPGTAAMAAAPANAGVERTASRGEEETVASVTTLDGTVLSLTDPAGRQSTVLLFLSPWCESYLAQSRPARAAACRSARERSERLARAGGARWIGIASGLWADRADLGEYRDKQHIAMPLSLDESGALFRHFHVSQVPIWVVLNPNGKVIRRIERVSPHLDEQLALADRS